MFKTEYAYATKAKEAEKEIEQQEYAEVDPQGEGQVAEGETAASKNLCTQYEPETNYPTLKKVTKVGG